MLYHQHQRNIDKVSVLDDVDFCIELLETDKINVAYIMNLIRNINMSDEKKRQKDIDHIRDELKRADNEQLHKKIDLIQAFLNKLEAGIGNTDIDEAYADFENAEKKLEEKTKKDDSETPDNKGAKK